MIPSTIKIGPFDIPVSLVEGLEFEGEACFGTYSDDPHSFEFDLSLNKRSAQTLSIIVHECLEAMDLIYGVRLNHQQIEQLSTAFTALLLDNRLPIPRKRTNPHT
jgi:hypothetical protein